MLTKNNAANPVHYPCRYNKFEFDAEVASIFDNMAERSIPLYRIAHDLHAHIAYTHISGQFDLLHRKQATILDVGASVGGFLRAICNQFQCDTTNGTSKLRYLAIDTSSSMVQEFHKQYPWAEALCCDIRTAPIHKNEVDIVCLMYVLQFVRPEDRDDLLSALYKSMKDNAIIFLGQKEAVDTATAPSFAWEYIRWRVGNGYTMDEIEAKTRALESVMWPETLSDTRKRLERVGFRLVRETTRWLQFSTLMARK